MANMYTSATKICALVALVCITSPLQVLEIEEVHGLSLKRVLPGLKLYPGALSKQPNPKLQVLLNRTGAAASGRTGATAPVLRRVQDENDHPAPMDTAFETDTFGSRGNHVVVVIHTNGHRIRESEGAFLAQTKNPYFLKVARDARDANLKMEGGAQTVADFYKLSHEDDMQKIAFCARRVSHRMPHWMILA